MYTLENLENELEYIKEQCIKKGIDPYDIPIQTGFINPVSMISINLLNYLGDYYAEINIEQI